MALKRGVFVVTMRVGAYNCHCYYYYCKKHTIGKAAPECRRRPLASLLRLGANTPLCCPGRLCPRLELVETRLILQDLERRARYVDGTCRLRLYAGFGFNVQRLGFGVWEGLAFRRVSGFGFLVPSFGFRVSGFGGFGVWEGLGIRVSEGLGFGV